MTDGKNTSPQTCVPLAREDLKPLGGHQANIVMEPLSGITPLQRRQVENQESQERRDSGIQSPGSGRIISPTKSEEGNSHHSGTNEGYYPWVNGLSPDCPNVSASAFPNSLSPPQGANLGAPPPPSPTVKKEEDADAAAAGNPQEQPAADVEMKVDAAVGTSRRLLKMNADMRVPRLNSRGQIKLSKCKHCKYVAETEFAFYEHMKTKHIPPEKLLECPYCDFVTQYKHHIEYHFRRHRGEKPFQCEKCKYTCINKSMLNSHMKSHSDHHAYRCKSCPCSFKYLHSLKVHLRKYSHEPAMVYNADGTPNPLQIIDVNGRRRGPRTNTSRASSTAPSLAEPMQAGPSGIAAAAAAAAYAPSWLQMQMQMQMMMQARTHMTQQIFLAAMQQQQVPLSLAQAVEEQQSTSSSTGDDPIDLSMPPVVCLYSTHTSADEASDNETDTADNSTPPPSPNQKHQCPHCKISFDNAAMYSIHMDYHGHDDPFTCRSCGVPCGDSVSLFVHVAHARH